MSIVTYVVKKSTVVEAGLIPSLVNVCLDSRDEYAISLLTDLSNTQQYTSLMLSCGLLIRYLRVCKIYPLFHNKCEDLYWNLSLLATVNQRTSTLSFLLKEIQLGVDLSPHLLDDWYGASDERRLLYPFYPFLDLILKASDRDISLILQSLRIFPATLSAICKANYRGNDQDAIECYYSIFEDLLCRDSQVLLIDDRILSSWKLFLLEVPEKNKIMRYVCPNLVETIIQCPDIQTILEVEVISTFFSSVKNPLRDEDFLQFLLDLIEDTVNVRVLQGKENAILLMDHLVELGILSFLVNAMNLKYSDSLGYVSPSQRSTLSSQDTTPLIEPEALAKGLKMILGLDPKYESQLRKTSLMTLVFSVFEEGS
jgi:hypothetical protein